MNMSKVKPVARRRNAPDSGLIDQYFDSKRRKELPDDNDK
jgi:hypothetical protein